MTTRNLFTWVLQLISSGILLYEAVLKFLSTPESVALFTRLGMEPSGRFLIATIESAAALLLLTTTFSVVGAFLGTAVLLGATIAHVTKIGFSSPLETILFFIAFSTCHGVLFLRRKSVPIIGETL